MPETAPPSAAEWMDYDETATHLGVSRRTLERAVAAGKIPYHRDPLMGRVRFRRTEVDNWMWNDGRRRR